MDFVKINTTKLTKFKSIHSEESSSSDSDDDISSVSSYYSSDDNTESSSDENNIPIKGEIINQLRLEQLKLENLALTIRNAKLSKENTILLEKIAIFEKNTEKENNNLNQVIFGIIFYILSIVSISIFII